MHQTTLTAQNKNLILSTLLMAGIIIALIAVGSAAAQAGAGTGLSMDSATGDLGSGLCNFAKTIETSLLPKGIAIAMAAFGFIKWLPTRKDGIPEIVGGGVGFLMTQNFSTIMSLFGMRNCTAGKTTFNNTDVITPIAQINHHAIEYTQNLVNLLS